MKMKMKTKEEKKEKKEKRKPNIPRGKMTQRKKVKKEEKKGNPGCERRSSIRERERGGMTVMRKEGKGKYKYI